MPRKPAALKCLETFARYVIEKVEFNEPVAQNLTGQFNGSFDCLVHMNPGGLWMKAAAPVLCSKQEDALTKLVLEIHAALKARQMNLPNSSSTFRVSPEENGLWQRVLKQVPHVLAAATVQPSKPAKSTVPSLEDGTFDYAPFRGNA